MIPPVINSKLAALDVLDHLAMNPSGWFPDSLLQRMTDARVAIITERWAAAIRALEDARDAIVEFVRVLKTAPEGSGPKDREAAVARANDELAQCISVLAWIDKRPEQ